MAAILIEPVAATRTEIAAHLTGLLKTLTDTLASEGYVGQPFQDDDGYPAMIFSIDHMRDRPATVTVQRAAWYGDRLPLQVDAFSNLGTRIRLVGPVSEGWRVYTSDGIRMRMTWNGESIRTLFADVLER